MPIITPRTFEFGFDWAKAPERSSVAAGRAVRASFPSSRLRVHGGTTQPANREPEPVKDRSNLNRLRLEFQFAGPAPVHRLTSAHALCSHDSGGLLSSSRPPRRRALRLHGRRKRSPRRHHRHRHLARAGVHQGVSRPPRVANQGRRRLQGREPRLSGQRQPRRRVCQDHPERLRRRVRRQHRRAPREGRCRPARKCRRTAAPGAGDAGDEGEKARVRRQAARGQPRGRTADRGAGQRDGHAAVQQLLRPLSSGHPEDAGHQIDR